jgi:hypothetical protein
MWNSTSTASRSTAQRTSRQACGTTGLPRLRQLPRARRPAPPRHQAPRQQVGAHKSDHERLLDDIRDIMDEHIEHGVLDDRAFSDRLAAWFGDHFKTFDARLHWYLKEKHP